MGLPGLGQDLLGKVWGEGDIWSPPSCNMQRAKSDRGLLADHLQAGRPPAWPCFQNSPASGRGGASPLRNCSMELDQGLTWW